MTDRERAQKGIKKMYISMVLLVCSEVLEIAGGFFEAEIITAPTLLELCETGASLFIVAALIMQVAGLTGARKYEKGYKNAFLITVITLVCIIVFAIVEDVLASTLNADLSFTEDIASIIAEVLSIVTDYMVIGATTNLLNQNKFEELAEDGGKIWKRILRLFIIAIIVGVFRGVLVGIADMVEESTVYTLLQAIGAIMQFVVGLLNILAYAKLREFLKESYDKI